MSFLKETEEWMPELAKEDQKYRETCEQISAYLTPKDQTDACFGMIKQLEREMQAADFSVS